MKRKQRAVATGQPALRSAIQRRAAGFDEGAFLRALAEVPDVPPEPRDRISPRSRRK